MKYVFYYLASHASLWPVTISGTGLCIILRRYVCNKSEKMTRYDEYYEFQMGKSFL